MPMKKIIFLFIISFLPTTLFATDIIINNPAFEIKNSGITNISKIEITNSETRVYVHCTFIPHWWTKFGNPFICESGTNNRLYATGIEGGEFNKEIYMPASGDSTFVLIFPKLENRIQKIDYGNDDKPEVFGISLNPEAERNQHQYIPTHINDWINEELDKAKRKTLIDPLSNKFFRQESARIIGYIKGYDKRLNLENGIIYLNNVIIREDRPAVITIHEDGRIEGTLFIDHPVYSIIDFDRQKLEFYIEPGQTLGIIIDWEDMLNADRYRNIRYKLKNTKYTGPAAKINEELMQAKVELDGINYRKIYDETEKLSPTDAYNFVIEETRKNEDQLRTLLNEKNFNPLTKTILNYDFKITQAQIILDRISFGNLDINDTIPSFYYDCIRQLPLNDQRLLIVPDYPWFINRLEFIKPLRDAWLQANETYMPKPEKDFFSYLFDELQLIPSTQDSEDIEYFKANSTMDFYSADIEPFERDSLIEMYTERMKMFHIRYRNYNEDYKKKYIEGLKPQATILEQKIKEMELMDSAYYTVLNLEPSLTYDIVKIRMLNNHYASIKVDNISYTHPTPLDKTITHPFLRNEAKYLFNKIFLNHGQIYDLPNSNSAEIIKRIIEPHKGKVLFIDFWGTTCGPCIYLIKENEYVRKKYKDNPDIRFLFITSEETSPPDRYKELVKEFELEYSYRLSNDDYKYLNELFRFNGMPHYVVIDKEGRILNDNFQMSNFEYELSKLLK